jgi:hypothetical protein
VEGVQDLEEVLVDLRLVQEAHLWSNAKTRRVSFGRRASDSALRTLIFFTYALA